MWWCNLENNVVVGGLYAAQQNDSQVQLDDSDSRIQAFYGTLQPSQWPSGFVPPLSIAQSLKVSDLNNQAQNLVNNAYPAPILAAFNGLYSQALNQGLTNRANYCEQLLAYGVQVSQAFLTAQTAVSGATTVSEVNAITLIVSGSDPGVSLAGALAITN